MPTPSNGDRGSSTLWWTASAGTRSLRCRCLGGACGGGARLLPPDALPTSAKPRAGPALGRACRAESSPGEGVKSDPVSEPCIPGNQSAQSGNQPHRRRSVGTVASARQSSPVANYDPAKRAPRRLRPRRSRLVHCGHVFRGAAASARTGEAGVVPLARSGNARSSSDRPASPRVRVSRRVLQATAHVAPRNDQWAHAGGLYGDW